MIGESKNLSFIKSVIIAFGMFSAIPVPRIDWNGKNMRYMMAAFPLVGVVIAILCGGWFILGQILSCVHKGFSPLFMALGFTLIPVFVTGGIHLDGFMDTCDALGSHASREKKLEILKDSHSGAFAVLGCVIYFLCYFVLSLEIFNILCGEVAAHMFENHFAQLMAFVPLLPVFVISRLLSAFTVATFPIAKDSGLVHTFATKSAKRFTAIWSYFWFLVISGGLIYLFNFEGIAFVATSLSMLCFYYVVAVRNFGGITGDTAGWFVQICELAGLAVFFIGLR